MRAMESSLNVVDMETVVGLDIEALIKYSGQGCCMEIKCFTSDKFFEEIKTWASRTNWQLQWTTKEYEDVENKTLVSMTKWLLQRNTKEV